MIEELPEDDEDETADLADWQAEEFKKLREIQSSDDWLEVPRRLSHEDYRIMENFCLGQEEPLRKILLTAIEGSGAFGRFRNAISRHGVQEDWYAFRLGAITEEAKAWLESEKIAYQ